MKRTHQPMETQPTTNSQPINRTTLIILMLSIVMIVTSPYLYLPHNTYFVDLVLYNGTIVTMADTPLDGVEAVGVKGGRIVHIGSFDEVSRYVHFGTRVVDLKGATMFPGFIDTYTHPLLNGIFDDWVPINMQSDPFTIIKSAVNNASTINSILYFVGYDSILGNELSFAEINEAINDHPMIFVDPLLREGYVNQKILDMADINPSNVPDLRDTQFLAENGMLTGHIRGTAAILYVLEKLENSNIPLPDILFDEYSKHGVTSIGAYLSAPFPQPENIIKKYAHYEHSIRVTAYLSPKLLDEVSGLLFFSEYFKVGGVSLNTMGNHVLDMNGISSQDLASITSLMDKYHVDYQLSIDVNDSNMDMVLQKLKVLPTKNHRINFCGSLTEKHLSDMASAKVYPSFYPGYLNYRNALSGTKDLDNLLPLKSTIFKNLTPSIFSNSPKGSLNMMKMIHDSVTGKNYNQISENQLPVLEAMRLITSYASIIIGEQSNVGSIEIGKFADFVVLDKNPLEVDTAEIVSIKVLKTYSSGKDVYSRTVDTLK
eukprot:TRINITY_DN12224_c0_g1_i1.p1 TRINITY_DN12224_c0_g1~~TRINITY_DN12224_c0_g1_i1.p1  ORF type:complete len:542 (-),score=94.86 TRINITY_DN12224_c0_g1_i1:139-1764(-)